MSENENPYSPPAAGSDEPHQVVPGASYAEPSQDDPFGAPAPQAPGWTMPHRGGSILGLGICGFAVCFICGLIAWIMGAKDLKQIDQGMRDPSGRGVTRAGMIIGAIATFVAGLLQIIYAVAIFSGM